MLYNRLTASLPSYGLCRCSLGCNVHSSSSFGRWERIAEEIQREEQRAAQKILDLLPANARLAVELQTTGGWSRSRPYGE